MSGLLSLTADDFVIQRATKGDVLCTKIPGLSLILFYALECKACQNVLPIFKSLPGRIGGCQFGIINVTQQRECVAKSRMTITPLHIVPYIIMYVNGQPLIVYKGPPDIEQIKNFIIEVAKNIQGKQQFTKGKIEKDANTSIPGYTIGIPLCGDDNVCYLEWDSAYTVMANANNQSGVGVPQTMTETINNQARMTQQGMSQGMSQGMAQATFQSLQARQGNPGVYGMAPMANNQTQAYNPPNRQGRNPYQSMNQNVQQVLQRS
jgi:hypothetical protein